MQASAPQLTKPSGIRSIAGFQRVFLIGRRLLKEAQDLSKRLVLLQRRKRKYRLFSL